MQRMPTKKAGFRLYGAMKRQAEHGLAALGSGPGIPPNSSVVDSGGPNSVDTPPNFWRQRPDSGSLLEFGRVRPTIPPIGPVRPPARPPHSGRRAGPTDRPPVTDRTPRTPGRLARSSRPTGVSATHHRQGAAQRARARRRIARRCPCLVVGRLHAARAPGNIWRRRHSGF